MEHLYKFTCKRKNCRAEVVSCENMLPEGWKYIGTRDACPHCASLYNKIVADHEQDIKNFWEGQ